MKAKWLISTVLILMMTVSSCAKTPADGSQKDTKEEPKQEIVMPNLSAPTEIAMPEGVNITAENLGYVYEGNTIGGDGGNSWGGHQSRVVRLSDGSVYTAITYINPGDDTNPETIYNVRKYNLLKLQHDGTWKSVLKDGFAGRDPVNLVKTSDDRIVFVTMTAPEEGKNQFMAVLNIFNPKTKKLTSTNMLQYKGEDANFEIGDTNYLGVGISPENVLYTWQIAKNKTVDYTTHYVQRADLGIGKMTPVSVSPYYKVTDKFRYCYPMIIAESGDRVTVLPVRDVKWSSIGKKKPSKDAFDYAFDELSIFNTSDGFKSFNRIPVYEEPQTDEFLAINVKAASAGDFYQDLAGNYHILYTTVGPTTKGKDELRHAVYDKDYKLIVNERLPFCDEQYGSYTGARIIQDKSGRFYYLAHKTGSDVLKVYPSDTELATSLAPAVDISLGGRDVQYSSLWLAVPRGGNSIEDYVDLTFSTGKDGINTGYVRINFK